MTNTLDIVLPECHAALDAIAQHLEHLPQEDRMKLDYAIHEAHQRVWKVEGVARADWYANTRFATDPFVRHMAMAYTAGYFAVIGLAWVCGIPTSAHDTMLTLIGALTATQVAICNYCFGNTSGAARKDSMLYHSTPIKPEGPPAQ